ncbi:MAG: cytochrome-c peroxidase [Gemmatimonadota bacterium]
MDRDIGTHSIGLLAAALVAACGADASAPVEPEEPAGAGSGAEALAARGGRPALVERGRRLFFEETFGGNGRTCGTCHPAPTLVLTPADIAELPPDDPFFAGEMDFDPEMARKGMIRYPLGGSSLFEPEVTVFRSIPTIRNVRHTGPFTTDGRATNLPEQALEAVMLHLLDGGVDEPGERLPTSAELEAIAAFQEAMSEPEDGGLGLGRLSTEARDGRKLFFGKAACTTCHLPPRFTDNEFHNIVAPTPGEPVPDPGRCRIDPSSPDCWSGAAFNTPQLRGVAKSPPFFHDNSQATLRDVVTFYNSARFSESPAAERLGIGGLDLTEAEVAALVAFLEAL